MAALGKVNAWIDKSCSALVTFTVVGANLCYLDLSADSVAMPVVTSACCATAAVSKVLKRVINQSRPNGAQKLSPGMPSNHATALSFLAVAACIGITKTNIVPDTWAATWFASQPPLMPSSPGTAAQVSLLLYSMYASCLRVHCGHHTFPQVAVGYLLGSASAMVLMSANYWNYHGNRAGGRIDELPWAAKALLLAASVSTGFVAFRSILRGSPLWNRHNAHG